MFSKWIKTPKNRYLKEWTQWKKNAPAEEKSSRKLAVLALQRCLLSKESTLDLSCLNLSSIPILPPHITKLNVEMNRLIALSELPDGLTELNCAYNCLIEWPRLPSELKILNCSMNNLVILPDLPDKLEELNCSKTNLLNLPKLPNGMKILNCYMNNLVNIRNLPPSLEYFYTGCNELVELPELPNTLKLLECSNNYLQYLPMLPPSITSISASNNRLNELPEELPSQLIFLQCMDNNITTLPESIANLNRLEGRVDLRANPLSDRTIQNIYAMLNQNNYRGPLIYFSMSMQRNSEHTTHSFIDSVISWFPSECKQEIISKFSTIAREKNTKPFSDFIDRLQDTCSFQRNLKFKQHVAQWLSRLADSPILRETTFAVALEATESCEDRITLAWNDMQKVELIHNIEVGQFDNKLPDLMIAAREMFRLEKLEHIAKEKTSVLHLLDEIEVYLGFQTQLCIPLRLTNIAKEMRFFDVSGITKSDLGLAELTVKTAENDHFPEWLAHWSPWQKFVERTEPALWEQAYDKKMNIYENEYQKRINAELDANNLTDDIDAERALGIKVMHDIDKAIFIPLTLDTLANKKQAALLNKPWNI
ncbi:NEL-type E3 ubiquitin ligase domain-containing protein [Providencia burhodogranariea]|uniref:RING-type E3 ubiquitin transferase n=1 Tax=Providencia burhodogranariea DSM 19968 TaxID=1141662 RepID=K8X841_9GAMM|nr:NEL-type E3 ubiquitin ligase domain-containing protein [Providencia burhodogranariea]EKT64595.1 invasion plasmid antigen [Providencia burhodogranariea DSM 19968]